MYQVCRCPRKLQTSLSYILTSSSDCSDDVVFLTIPSIQCLSVYDNTLRREALDRELKMHYTRGTLKSRPKDSSTMKLVQGFGVSSPQRTETGTR